MYGNQNPALQFLQGGHQSQQYRQPNNYSINQQMRPIYNNPPPPPQQTIIIVNKKK